MKENQRLRRIMDLLKVKTQKDFAQAIKIKEGTLSGILNLEGKGTVSRAIKDRLESIYHVNINWLETGEGEEFLATGPVNDISKVGVPYYNLPIADFKHMELMEEKPEYFVNYMPFNDCSAYVPVYGDSMYPKYASGEIIAIKEIVNLDVIQWGEAYVIITNENTNGLKSIKLIHEHPDPKKIILKSSNPNFKGEMVIKKEDIKSLYAIKGKITRNMI